MRRARLAAVCAAILALPATALAQPGGDAGRGDSIFQDQCVMCHAPGGGGQAPSLVGVIGRPAATVPGAIYSRGLAASGIVWTPGDLDVFLADPARRVPGTAMPIALPDPKDRADVIAYLRSGENRP